ncbi:MAG: YIP1 family protein [Chlamydiota bacterium]|jgi:hypothetical protein
MTSKFGFNPWVTIWTQPKKTIRAIVNKDPRYHFFYLATIYALQTILFLANNWQLAQVYSVVFIVFAAIAVSPFFGVVFLYFNTWVLHFTGKWLKGNAPFLHVRAALSWSKVPLIISLLMWFVLLVFSSDIILSKGEGAITTLFINLISLIAGIWSFVILVQNVQEVQGFTIARSIGNVILAFVISYVLIFLFSNVFYYFVSLIKQ